MITGRGGRTGNLRREERPEGFSEALRVRLHHPLKQILVRQSSERLMGRHVAPPRALWSRQAYPISTGTHGLRLSERCDTVWSMRVLVLSTR